MNAKELSEKRTKLLLHVHQATLVGGLTEEKYEELRYELLTPDMTVEDFIKLGFSLGELKLDKDKIVFIRRN